MTINGRRDSIDENLVEHHAKKLDVERKTGSNTGVRFDRNRVTRLSRCSRRSRETKSRSKEHTARGDAVLCTATELISFDEAPIEPRHVRSNEQATSNRFHTTPRTISTFPFRDRTGLYLRIFRPSVATHREFAPRHVQSSFNLFVIRAWLF